LDIVASVIKIVIEDVNKLFKFDMTREHNHRYHESCTPSASGKGQTLPNIGPFFINLGRATSSTPDLYITKTKRIMI
jgi:hypothetical protein